MTVPTRVAVIPVHRRGSIAAHAIVDAEDVAVVGQYRWTLNLNGYAWRSVDGGRRHIYLHRAIAGATWGDGTYVDHINRDRMDCRRVNLRIVTPQQSAQNKPALRGRFRGVSFDASRGRWSAHAQLDGKRRFLGRFDTEEEAAAAAAQWRREHMPFSEEGTGVMPVTGPIPIPLPPTDEEDDR